MKNKLIASYVMIMAFFLLAGIGEAKPRFSFKLAGGYGTISTGDLNTIINSIDSSFRDLVGVTALFIEDEQENLNSGPDFEGEFIINLTEKVGIGISSGYIHRRKSSEAGFIFGSLLGFNAALESMGAAIPVKISAYYFLPIKSRMNLYLKGGIGYYFGKLTYDSKLNADIFIFALPSWERSVDMKDNTIGLNGGIGFEYDVAKNIGLFIEGAARYAKLKDWKGDEIYTDAYGQTDKISGTLWYCEALHNQTGIYYPSFKVSKDEPTSETGSYKNIRKAEIDFSGFSLRLGLRIKF